MAKSKIVNDHDIATLYVDDRPFFCYAGEIHNSSASSAAFMDEEVWPNLRGLNMNCVIAPVYWELIEPEEGSFNFTSVDDLIAGARREGMKLSLLWFGLWKNGESFYVPAWMKKDTQTYFRVRKSSGEVTRTISPLCEAGIQKDKTAFAALMKHLRETDEKDATVIVMQVENEIGVLGTDFDYSPEAVAAFTEEVPQAVAEEFGVSGTWKEAFGAEAYEQFLCCRYAMAVETIAAAGKAEYDLPMYANAWLKQYPWYAGSYPTGGPIIERRRMWKTMAPSLFALAPDIYVPYCADIMDRYAEDGNPLFIPEIRKDTVTASYCLYAFLRHNAISYSPFGIEELSMDPDSIDKPSPELMAALNIDPSAFDIAGSKEYLSAVYSFLKNFEPIYLKVRGTDQIQSWVRHSETDFGALLPFGEYDIAVSYAPKMPLKPLAAGAAVQLEKDTFLVLGMMSGIEFRPKDGSGKTAGILRLEEGSIVNGEWKARRVMNGDEQMRLNLPDQISCYKLVLYQY